MSRTTSEKLVRAGALAAAAVGAYKLIRSWSSYSFKDRVVLVTGGSRGLGLVLARQLVAQGAKVAILARDAAELERAATDLRARGGTVLTIPGDIGKREVAEGAVEKTVAKFGRLDVVINNAGIIQFGPVAHVKPEDFEATMAVHFWGPLHTTQAALPHLAKQKGARVVNIASFGGKLSFPHLLPYCASKFALVGLSWGQRSALAKHGIPVTTVCPGLMRTGSHLQAQFKGKHRTEFFVFALSMCVPMLSVSAEAAAKKILGACKRGEAELVIGWPYRILVSLAPLVPGLTTAGMGLMDRLLPGPTGSQGDTALPGWACRSWASKLISVVTDGPSRRNNELPDKESARA